MNALQRGIKKYMLLERLELTARGLADLTYVLATTPHATSSIIDKKVRRLEQERIKESITTENRRCASAWLSQLKKEGFVEKSGLLWGLTKIGQRELDRLRRHIELTTAYAKPIKSAVIIIISFDIPERMRGQRNWLRFVFKQLNFVQLHKSVLIGKILLPKALLAEIKFRKLTQYIEIMQITKQGTMRKII